MSAVRPVDGRSEKCSITRLGMIDLARDGRAGLSARNGGPIK